MEKTDTGKIMLFPDPYVFSAGRYDLLEVVGIILLSKLTSEQMS
jgi:hypothetical protein